MDKSGNLIKAEEIIGLLSASDPAPDGLSGPGSKFDKKFSYLIPYIQYYLIYF